MAHLKLKTARLQHVLCLMQRFYHHPLHVNEWQEEGIKEEFNRLFLLLERAIQK